MASERIEVKSFLPDRESNPGLPRDRRRSSPLDYRGLVQEKRKESLKVHGDMDGDFFFSFVCPLSSLLSILSVNVGVSALRTGFP